MKRRCFAVLLISGILLAAAIPLAITLSNPSADVDSSPDYIQTVYRNLTEIEKPGPKYVSGELIIRFKKEATEERIAGLRVEQDSEEVDVSPFTFARVWRVPPSKTVEEWVGFFDKLPLVEYVEPNYVRYALWYPNDSYYVYQWHFDDDHTNNLGGVSSNPYGGVNGGGIRMEEAWSITSGASNVVVAVIDTGVAYEDYSVPRYEWRTVKPGVKTYQKAPDLVGTSFWQNGDEVAGNGVDDDGNGFVDDVNGWDFVNGDAHPNDNNAHGTHVTGTIAQTSDNGLGVAGIAFNTTIMPVKVLDYRGSGTDVQVADGIYYAVDNGAKVINLSLGGDDPSTTLENAVAYAYDNGVVVIASSGNDGTESIGYPAGYNDYVIAVGATRYDETRASYSDYGSSLDLVAPGGDVYADQNEDGYGDGVLQQTFKPYETFVDKADPTDWAYWFFDGTSMAAPHVSGVAALLLAQDPTLTPDQIRNALESTAEDLGNPGRDDTYGWGLIDAQAALQSIVPPVFACMVRGFDNRIYYRIHNSSSDSWDSWNALPGATCDSPAAAVCCGRLHIVVRGMDEYSLWYGWINLTDHTFSEWTRLSGATPSAPTLTSNGTALYLVVRGMNNRTYYRSYDCASHAWEEWNAVPSGAACDSPAAAMVGGSLHVVARGMDENSLWHGTLTNPADPASFSGWTRLSGSTPSAPTLASNDTMLSLVVRGFNDRIYYRIYDGSWEEWTVLPGATCDSPGAALLGNDLHIVVRGMDGNTLWHGYLTDPADPESFSGWTRLNGATSSAPTLTS